MEYKKDKKTFLVKMNGKYVPCSITTSLDKHGYYKLNYKPLYSKCEDFVTNKVTDILSVKSMYDKNIQSDIFTSSLRTKHPNGNDYAIFFDNDAEIIHESTGIGWNSMMVGCIGQICKLKGTYDNDHSRVVRDGYSWIVHNSCLRYINIDLF